MNKRLYSLDILKFVLSIIIVFHHFQQVLGITFENGINFYCGKIQFGYIVEFFFIISGFLSNFIVIEKNEKIKFKNYILNKAVRLYPVIMISIVVNVIMMLYFRYQYGFWWQNMTPGLWRIWNSLWLTFAGGAVCDIDIAINNPMWYVCVLMICYTLFWIITVNCKKMNISPLYGFGVMCFMGVGIYQYNINLPFANQSTARGYVAYSLGIILWYIYNYIDQVFIQVVSYLIAFICIVAGIRDFDAYYDNQWGIFTFILFPSLFFIALGLNKFLNARFWYELGAISFEIYVWHVAGLFFMEIIQSKYDIVYTRTHMYLFAIFMVCFSIIMTVFLEKPLINILRKKIMCRLEQ